MSKAIILAALILLSAVPLIASAATTVCSPPQQTGFTRISGDYYFSAARGDFFKEVNDWPGIQLRSHFCEVEGLIPGDACAGGRNCTTDPRAVPSRPDELS